MENYEGQYVVLKLAGCAVPVYISKDDTNSYTVTLTDNSTMTYQKEDVTIIETGADEAFERLSTLLLGEKY